MLSELPESALPPLDSLAWWRRGLRCLPGAVAVGVAPILVALTGIVLFDLLPGRGTGRPETTTVQLLAGAYALFALALIARTRLRRPPTTLCGLTFQPESAVAAPERDRPASPDLAVKWISRRFDPGHGHVVDLRRDVRDLGLALQDAQNSADGARRLVLAPSLLFPAALALGYEWAPPADVRLREVGPRGTARDGEFTWSLRRMLKARPDVLDQWGDPVPEEPDASVRTVLLSFLIAPDAERTVEQVVTESGQECDRAWIVGSVDTSGPEPRLMPVQVTGTRRSRPRSGSRPARVTAWDAARTIGHWIRRAQESYPQATVVLTGQVPQTAALAAGWYLAGAEGHSFPWRRLVTLTRFDADRYASRPLWVRDGQGDPRRLLPEVVKPDSEDLMLINLTPERLTIFDEQDEPVVEIEAHPVSATVVEEQEPASPIGCDDVEIPRREVHLTQRVAGLPGPAQDVLLVVSRATAQARTDRDDLLFPLDEVRDEEGRVIGCRALGRFVPELQAVG